MFLLKLPLFILTLYGLILNSAANCPKGKVLLSFFSLNSWNTVACLMSFDCHVFLMSLICSCDHQNKPLIVSIIEGQRLQAKKNQGLQCEDCKNGFFQETVNYSQSCKVCTKCDKGEAWSTLLHLYFYGCKFPPFPWLMCSLSRR